MMEQQDSPIVEPRASALLSIGPKTNTRKVSDFDEQFADFPDKYSITAKHPGMAEDEIIKAGSRIEGKTAPRNRATRRAMGGMGASNEDTEATIGFDVAPAHAFVAKCVHQIVGFKLSADEGGTGPVTDETWDPAHGGDNEANKTIYRGLLESALRDPLEQWLDEVAGRTEAAEEILGEAKNA